MKIYFLFEFQLVPFAFGLILGDLFMMPPRLKYREVAIFSKKAFHGRTNFGEQIYGGIVLHARNNDQVMQREGGISQNAFPSNLDTVNLKIFPNNGGVFT